MPEDLIKVHVTPAQREYLEFLVNRRIHDLQLREGRGGAGLGAGRKMPDPSAEYLELEKIKWELQQAGT